MEAAYGIGVQNRYALFLDEDDNAADPYQLLVNPAEVETKAKSNVAKSGLKGSGGVPSAAGGNLASKPNHHQQSGNKQSSALTESKQQNVVSNQKDSGRQNNRSNNRGGLNAPNREPRANRENQENRTNRSPRTNNTGANFESKPDDLSGGKDFRDGKESRRHPFSGNRGGPRGGGRPGQGQGAPDERRFGKRDFNRHSGSDKSGVKSGFQKREGGGAHNWGRPVDEYSAAGEGEELANGNQSLVEDKEKHENENQANVGGDEAGGEVTGEEEPKNDEPLLKTLDEYKRELEEKRLHTQFNIRKANEGEDKTKWKKTYVLAKKPPADEDEVEYEEIEVEEEHKRRNRQVLDIEINFRPSDEGREFTRRGRGGPGGRGGGPGGRRPPQDGDATRRTPRPDRSANAGGPNPNGGATPNEGGAGAGGPRGGGRPSRGGGRDRNTRFQPAPKFDDLNDFPSLSS